jgi:hypothetical protein
MGKKNWDIKHRLFEMQFIKCSQRMLHEVTGKSVIMAMCDPETGNNAKDVYSYGTALSVISASVSDVSMTCS